MQPLVMLLLLAATPLAINAEDCSEQLGIPDNTNEIKHNLYRGEQEFTVSMLEVIRKTTPNENVFFSPYSTYHTLLLAYFGANGHTEAELKKALRLDWSKSKGDVRSAYRLEKQNRQMRSLQSPLLKFASADRIYFDKHITVSSCWSDVLSNELIQLDFAKEAERSRLQINGWIANVTRNEIPEMLTPGDIDSTTNVVLANAAYFKGQWASKFDPQDTKLAPFYTTNSEMSLVPMMYKKGNYQLTIDERIGAHVLQMPYRTSEKENDGDDIDSGITMVIVLPPFVSRTKDRSSLEEVLSKLKPETIKEALAEGMTREIEITMPKFEFEQRLELVPILRNMGISSIFETSANFTGFSADQSISFGDAKHVAKIKVDEEGSTAAAATVFVSFRSARPIEPTKFECNHPFLFLIYDKNSNAILFTGIYRDPKTKQ